MKNGLFMAFTLTAVMALVGADRLPAQEPGYRLEKKLIIDKGKQIASIYGGRTLLMKGEFGLVYGTFRNAGGFAAYYDSMIDLYKNGKLLKTYKYVGDFGYYGNSWYIVGTVNDKNTDSGVNGTLYIESNGKSYFYDNYGYGSNICFNAMGTSWGFEKTKNKKRHVYVDGKEYGPFNSQIDGIIIDRGSWYGVNSNFIDHNHAIVVKDGVEGDFGTTDKECISSYDFGPGERIDVKRKADGEYATIRNKLYGPYDQISYELKLSRTGGKWGFYYRQKNDLYIVVNDAKYGPYGNIELASSIRFNHDGSVWYAPLAMEHNKTIINGKIENIGCTNPNFLKTKSGVSDQWFSVEDGGTYLVTLRGAGEKTDEEDGFGRLIGKVHSVDYSSGEIVVSSPKAGELIKMGGLLYLKLNDRKVTLKAQFPMQTVAKCRLLPKYKGELKSVRKGMDVYR